jgi:hypothetical protein
MWCRHAVTYRQKIYLFLIFCILKLIFLCFRQFPYVGCALGIMLSSLILVLDYLSFREVGGHLFYFFALRY